MIQSFISVTKIQPIKRLLRLVNIYAGCTGWVVICLCASPERASCAPRTPQADVQLVYPLAYYERFSAMEYLQLPAGLRRLIRKEIRKDIQSNLSYYAALPPQHLTKLQWMRKEMVEKLHERIAEEAGVVSPKTDAEEGDDPIVLTKTSAELVAAYQNGRAILVPPPQQ